MEEERCRPVTASVGGVLFAVGPTDAEKQYRQSLTSANSNSSSPWDALAHQAASTLTHSVVGKRAVRVHRSIDDNYGDVELNQHADDGPNGEGPVGLGARDVDDVRRGGVDGQGAAVA